MKATRTVTWKTKDGKEAKVEITKTKEVYNNIADADGYKIDLGKKTYESLEITINVNGEVKVRSFRAPEPISPRFYRNYEQLKAAGAYASLGDAFINEENYNRVIAAIEELETEVTGTKEYAEIKAQEETKEAKKLAAGKAEAKHYSEMVKSGLCPKCGTWCYGDCEVR